ncbi:MAG: hypothetical protein WCM93_16540 [Bacteroidota bacterium]
MDIHAHHLHKAPGEKAWHYFFEFLMLFLAVFCGFLAEYKLEHKIEKDREKEFIISFVKELETDLYWIKLFEPDSVSYERQDKLAMLLLSNDRSDSAIKKMYLLFPSLNNGGGVIFKNTTITQLKNSGNLRLIRNRAVADSIIGLDASYNFSNLLMEWRNKLTYDNVRQASDVFDAQYFDPALNWIRVNADYLYKYSPKLLTSDEKLLHSLGYNVKFQANFNYQYYRAILKHKNYTIRLIDFFEKEYKLKDL